MVNGHHLMSGWMDHKNLKEMNEGKLKDNVKPSTLSTRASRCL
jgi:hypothetical protein